MVSHWVATEGVGEGLVLFTVLVPRKRKGEMEVVPEQDAMASPTAANPVLVPVASKSFCVTRDASSAAVRDTFEDAKASARAVES